MSRLIIDVSYHNGVINWERVKASGCAGANHRCGYGDKIASQDDKQWVRNLAECERLGIPVGVYLYSYATCDRQAKSELEHILRLIKGHTFQLPIFLDVEEPGTQGYAPKAREIVCEGLKANGYTPGIYASLSWFNNYLGNVRGKYVEWMARYKNLPEDLVPYWDYDAPNIPNEPRDASAAACTASALYELSTYIPNKGYKETADRIMESLASPAYRAEVGTNGNFILMHSVGSIPHGAEIDVPLNYADYYILEALMRKRDLEK